jgi:hypothetical protein
MFYVRLRERQENTTGRTPNKPLQIKAKVVETINFFFFFLEKTIKFHYCIELYNSLSKNIKLNIITAK